jgi:hypothetical protein
MDPVLSILKSEVGNGVRRKLRELPDKPLIRCEKCTKSPEDIGENIKFMQCSICKAKLDFSVYYCSQYVFVTLSSPSFPHLALKSHSACQREDWREHKKICGKQKSTKQLRGGNSRLGNKSVLEAQHL